MFKVGEHIVCVDSTVDPEVRAQFKNWVVKDQEYVVRGTRMDLEGNVGLLLEGVHNGLVHNDFLGGKFEPAFASIRFRKLVPDVDISELLEELELVH